MNLRENILIFEFLLAGIGIGHFALRSVLRDSAGASNRTGTIHLDSLRFPRNVWSADVK